MATLKAPSLPVVGASFIACDKEPFDNNLFSILHSTSRLTLSVYLPTTYISEELMAIALALSTREGPLELSVVTAKTEEPLERFLFSIRQRSPPKSSFPTTYA